jgi:hypothetical protein
MVGGEVTAKLELLVAVEVPTVTVILPAVAPLGTATISFVVVADETVADVPLNLTLSFVFVALKFVPLMVTEVPIGPLVGEKLEIVGDAAQADDVRNRADQSMRNVAWYSQENTPCGLHEAPIADIRSLPAAIGHDGGKFLRNCSPHLPQRCQDHPRYGSVFFTVSRLYIAVNGPELP